MTLINWRQNATHNVKHNYTRWLYIVHAKEIRIIDKVSIIFFIAFGNLVAMIQTN